MCPANGLTVAVRPSSPPEIATRERETAAPSFSLHDLLSSVPVRLAHTTRAYHWNAGPLPGYRLAANMSLSCTYPVPPT